jgi:hypothetical protein
MARMDYCLKCEMTRTDTVCPVCGERTLPSWALVQALSNALEDIQQALSSPQSADRRHSYPIRCVRIAMKTNTCPRQTGHARRQAISVPAGEGSWNR